MLAALELRGRQALHVDDRAAALGQALVQGLELLGLTLEECALEGGTVDLGVSDLLDLGAHRGGQAVQHVGRGA